jgi:hypothetical protein
MTPLVRPADPCLTIRNGSKGKCLCKTGDTGFSSELGIDKYIIIALSQKEMGQNGVSGQVLLRFAPFLLQ